MSLRKRTSKSVAKRHDLDYFKKGSPIRLWQWRLALIALVGAVIWIGLSSYRNANAFSAGPMSAQHAVFGAKCEACHIPVVRGAGWLPVIGDRKKVPDSACLNCHQVGTHHTDKAATTESCSSCHLEHKGAMHLAAVENNGCTQCHANLETKGAATVATHIRSFTDGHPDFEPLHHVSAELKDAAFALKYNHAVHMKPGLLGPIPAPGQPQTKVTLQCASCHRVDIAANGKPDPTGVIAPVKFDRDCRSCHSLEFDRRIAEQAPHGDAEAALQFVKTSLAASPATRNDPNALAKAETILFREKCSLCHTVNGAQDMPHLVAASMRSPVSQIVDNPVVLTTTPVIAKPHQPEHWFAAAVFSHTAHNAVQCEECHTAALSSTSGKDVMMPNIATCKRCHDGQTRPQGPVLASGHAESGCFLCHIYHEGTPEKASTSTTHNTFRIDELVRH